ncbi:MAG: deoxyribonuclease V [Deferribacteres bacterium]|nr:deoxyribonuclease V [Deferribacteres bacterium]
MKLKKLHPWDVTPEEAVKIQKALARLVVKDGKPDRLRYIAGIDVSMNRFDRFGYAAVVVFSYPELEVVEVASSKREITFPYIPGLLSFRETPIIAEALEKLKTEPDVIFLDGQGIAHPRRFGIASHIGVLLDKPTIGVAKTRLVGEYEEPPSEKGAWSPLKDKGEVIGAVLRTKNRVKPVFVSTGHRISLEEAVKLTLSVARGYRIPEPTRIAHITVNRIRRDEGTKQLNLFE